MELLAALPLGHYLLATFFVVVCVLTILVVLIQKGRGGGLSGAFGGVGGHSAFGAKTGDVFTWITVVLAALFLVVSVWLNFTFRELPSNAAAMVKPPGTQAPTTQPAPPGGPTGN